MTDNEIVAEFFRAKGYRIADIKRPNANGPDLEIFADHGSYRIEIKRVIRGTRSWRAKPVLPNRRTDDFVALILPDGAVHVEPMAEHLLKCGPTGARQLTKLVRLLCHE